MRKLWSILSGLLIAAVFLAACGGGAGEPAELIDVRTALETMEENLGREVCVRGFPVAYFYSYTYSGAKVYSIFFSDSAEDFYGEVESVEEVRDGWLETIVHEDDSLWQSVREIFNAKRELEEYKLLLKGTKSYISGVYYDFVAMR